MKYAGQIVDDLDMVNKKYVDERSSDVGYSCETTQEFLFEETVTTEGNWTPVAEFSYTDFIQADRLYVDFNGTEYIAEKTFGDDLTCSYGAPWDDDSGTYDWSVCPFCIDSASDGVNGIATPTAGTYNVGVVSETLEVTTSECFGKAVKTFRKQAFRWLEQASWSNNEQSITVDGLKSDDIVIVSPEPFLIQSYTEAGIYCAHQSTNSLTFKCSTVPSGDVLVNILIIK